MPPGEQLVILMDFVRYLRVKHPHLRDRPQYRDLLEQMIEAYESYILVQLEQARIDQLFEAAQRLITSA